MLDPKLTQQSLARPLTAWERDFAAALEAAFAAGHHDSAALALALTAAGVAQSNGTTLAWTASTVEAALQTLNAGLDRAYAEHGIGP